MADDDEVTKLQGVREASCEAARDHDDADSARSTSACSDPDAAETPDRLADVASDEEEPAEARRSARSAAPARSPPTHRQQEAQANHGSVARGSRHSEVQCGGQWGKQRRQRQSNWESWPAKGSREGQPRMEGPQARGRGQQRHAGVAGSGGKRQCQFTIGIEEEPRFRVVRRLLGFHGKHVKRIAEQSGAKLRLRGRGSGFKEGPEQAESRDPLMLCVSAPDPRSYDLAVRLVREHLEEIYGQHCETFPGVDALRINLHEGPREGSF